MAISTTLLLAQVPEVQAISAAGLIGLHCSHRGARGCLHHLVALTTLLFGRLPRRQLSARAVNRRRKSEAPVRPAFSHYLSLGLEFMIGASMIKTILSPDLQQVGIVGGMVLIRAMVGLYPRWESLDTANISQAANNDVSVTPVQSDSTRVEVAVARVEPAVCRSHERDCRCPRGNACRCVLMCGRQVV